MDHIESTQPVLHTQISTRVPSAGKGELSCFSSKPHTALTVLSLSRDDSCLRLFSCGDSPRFSLPSSPFFLSLANQHDADSQSMGRPSALPELGYGPLSDRHSACSSGVSLCDSWATRQPRAVFETRQDAGRLHSPPPVQQTRQSPGLHDRPTHH